MRRRPVWYVVSILILGVALLAISCGGTTSEPTKQSTTEEPAAEESATEEPAATGSPTAVPHALAGRDDCLQCHGENAFKPFPDDHIGRSNETCTACHQPAD